MPQLKNLYMDTTKDVAEKIPTWTREQIICWSEASMLERRLTQRGIVLTNEVLLSVAPTPQEPGVHVPIYHRQGVLSGSNLGQNIWGAKFQPHAETLQMSFTDKKIALGKRRKEVGGKTDSAEALGPRLGTDVEPLNFWVMDADVTESIMQEWQCAASLDFGADCGVRALSHVKMGKPYVGVCWTELHKQRLTAHLINQVFSLMLDPKSTLHEAELVRLCSGGSTDEGKLPKKPKKDDSKKEKKEGKKEDKDEDEGEKDKKDPKKKKGEGQEPAVKKPRISGSGAEGGDRRSELLAKIKEMQKGGGGGANLFFETEAAPGSDDENGDGTEA